MGNCFTLLGLNEDATREQILEAYERKKLLYMGVTFEEDPKYAKKKLKELAEAVQDAWHMAEPGESGEAEPEQENPLQQLLSEDELYMQELYRKYLTGRLNRAAGLKRKKQSAAEKKADGAYKRSVIGFWTAIIGMILLIGYLI